MNGLGSNKHDSGTNTASYRDQFDNKELKIQQYFFCLLTHQISA